ncbi:MAG TPA: CoA transferase [Ramlibacter sp.]|uniref:CaiB/BaiF CoA transferase family protein n=1 Tax=Ramlibacter sp. TaxID=1917967 RepID=UPI002D04B1A4|nr:CoA transferase [Ramlibacter sp.]HVZ42217.1 CoA transferase [Ramlibacter sp.]
MTTNSRRGPLDAVRVLDLTNMLSGPYCTRLLADLGAEVIKVEPPHGDHNRGRRPVRDGCSSFFGQLNCGKHSVVLDLKTPEGIATARAIAADCDVVVENWRPGVADRLGLGYEALRALRPQLVYCSISGFGQAGPHSRRPAYAPIVHAASGFDLAQVEYQGGGKPPNTATYTADVFGGMSAFAAIQSALFARERTGEGQYIDVALLDGMLNILVAECQEWQAPTPAKSRVYPPLRATDGFIVIAPTSQKNFEALCGVIGKTEWLTEARFGNTVARERNWAELMSLIEEWTRTRTAADGERQLMAAGVPCTRYLTVAEAMQSEQVRARGATTAVRDAAGSYLVPNAPFRMPGVDALPRPHVPALGEHTAEILARYCRAAAPAAAA